MTNVSVVIPTYNEEENIQDLLKKIDQQLQKKELEIIIVDDSEDSTASKVRNTDTDAEVKLIERDEPKGIGSAYQLGFSKAEGDKIVQMDADFSHQPKYIPELLEALDKNDVAVGSRYVEGGDRNDPIYRRINPLIGSYLYQYGLGSPVRDVTSGFKAFDREALDELPEDLPYGFHFQAASLMALIEKDLDIKEVPIDFKPRRAGEPKYSIEDFLNNVKLLLKLLKSKRLER